MTACAAPAVFRFPRGLLWVVVAGGSILAGLLLIAILEPGWLLKDQAFVPAWRWGTVLVLSSIVAALSIVLFRAFGLKFEVDEHQITQVTATGESKSLRWKEIARIWERPWRQRLELRDAAADVKLKVPFQLARIDRLRDLILARTDWPWLLDEEPLPPGTPIVLPREFRFLGPFRIAKVVLLVVSLLCGLYLGWLSLEPPFRRNPVLLTALRGYCLAQAWISASFLLGTRRGVRVEQAMIVVHQILRSQRYPVDQIAEVQVRSWRDKYAYVYPLVHLILKDGRRVPFPDLRVSSLLIYRTVLAALGRLPAVVER